MAYADLQPQSRRSASPLYERTPRGSARRTREDYSYRRKVFGLHAERRSDSDEDGLQSDDMSDFVVEDEEEEEEEEEVWCRRVPGIWGLGRGSADVYTVIYGSSRFCWCLNWTNQKNASASNG